MLIMRKFDFELPPFVLKHAEALKKVTPERRLLEYACRPVMTEVIYQRPESRLLWTYVTQDYDDPDMLPCTLSFIDNWRKNINGKLVEVRVDIGVGVLNSRVERLFGVLH